MSRRALFVPFCPETTGFLAAIVSFCFVLSSMVPRRSVPIRCQFSRKCSTHVQLGFCPGNDTSPLRFSVRRPLSHAQLTNRNFNQNFERAGNSEEGALRSVERHLLLVQSLTPLGVSVVSRADEHLSAEEVEDDPKHPIVR